MSEESVTLAKLVWEDPQTNRLQEFDLVEGATVSIGRSPDNELHLPEKTVSRHHASVIYQAGVFLISDTRSANGVFVNDEQIHEQYPLIDGDIIRLYIPTLRFISATSDTGIILDEEVTAHAHVKRPRLFVTSGSSNGTVIVLDRENMTFGRAVSNATWDVALPDKAISRPHARIYMQDQAWYIEDLGSANGTMVNGDYISESIALYDGIEITMGTTNLVFRLDA